MTLRCVGREFLGDQLAFLDILDEWGSFFQLIFVLVNNDRLLHGRFLSNIRVHDPVWFFFPFTPNRVLQRLLFADKVVHVALVKLLRIGILELVPHRLLISRVEGLLVLCYIWDLQLWELALQRFLGFENLRVLVTISFCLQVLVRSNIIPVYLVLDTTGEPSWLLGTFLLLGEVDGAEVGWILVE